MTHRVRPWWVAAAVLLGSVAGSVSHAAAGGGCVMPAESLVGWWRGDSNAQDSAGTKHGSLRNGAGFAGGAVGQAFSLDGVNDHVEIPHSAALDFPGSFTVAAWIRTTSTATQYVVSKYECGGTCPAGVANSQYTLVLGGGRPSASIRDTDGGGPADTAGGQALTGTTFVADGRRHHVAMMRDLANGTFRLYVDGRLDASAPLNAGATAAVKDDDGEADPLLIGALVSAGTGTRALFFAGQIDEVSLHARALGEGEIAGMSACHVPSSFDIALTCPTTVGRGEMFTATLTLTNRNSDTRTVAVGMVGLHVGDLRVVGPTKLTLAASVPPGVATPASCAGFESTVPLQTLTTGAILMPASARPGGMATVSVGLLGRVGASTKRRHLATEVCSIEVAR